MCFRVLRQGSGDSSGALFAIYARSYLESLSIFSAAIANQDDFGTLRYSHSRAISSNS